jgi:hypothetical protein
MATRPANTALRAVQGVSVLIAVLTFAVGLWGRANTHELTHATVLHGFGWITVPAARFLMSVTWNGEVVALLIVSALFGALTYWVLVLAAAKAVANRSR